jgi:hypothetical protein
VTGIYATVASTWLYQRFEVPPDPAALAAGVSTQVAAGDRLSTPDVPVTRADELPERVPAGQLVILGDCGALYRSTGAGWSTVELSDTRGHLSASVQLDGLDERGPVPLVALGTTDAHMVIGLEGVTERTARFVIDSNGAVRRGEPFTLSDDPERRVEIWADTTLGSLFIDLDGNEYFQFGAPPSDQVAAWGANPFGGTIAQSSEGAVTPLPNDTPVCDRLDAG